jgi:hypothetical protein
LKVQNLFLNLSIYLFSKLLKQLSKVQETTLTTFKPNDTTSISTSGSNDTTSTSTPISTSTISLSNSFDSFAFKIDFDSDDAVQIILNLYGNETETDEYGGELKIDYSYNDEDGYNVTDISSISNFKLYKIFRN